VVNTIYQILRTARPRQWLKNLSLFAAPMLSGGLFTHDRLLMTSQAFFAFCAISSGVYFINDIIDAPRDRKHPIKSNRPIASRKLSEKTAWVVAFVLILTSIGYSFVNIGTFFTYAMISYVVIQLLYSLYFRNVIILDSLVVATGFVIRVFAGGFASLTSISSWLILATIGVSLLLAFGKRRSEKTILAKYLGSKDITDTRKTLRHYPDSLLDSMISMSATYTIISYSLFAFMVSPQIAGKKLAGYLPSILGSPKWMMLTIPFVIYGVARYLYVIYEKQEGESPERVLLSDVPLLLSVLLWGLTIMVIIYIMPIIA